MWGFASIRPFKIVSREGKPIIKVKHRDEFKEFVRAPNSGLEIRTFGELYSLTLADVW